MWSLLLLLLGLVAPSIQSDGDKAVENCMLQMRRSKVNWRDYYGENDTIPQSVQMFLIKGENDMDICALYLEGCDSYCNNTAAILKGPDFMVPDCEENMETFSEAEQRTVEDIPGSRSLGDSPMSASEESESNNIVPPANIGDLISSIQNVQRPSGISAVSSVASSSSPDSAVSSGASSSSPDSAVSSDSEDIRRMISDFEGELNIARSLITPEDRSLEQGESVPSNTAEPSLTTLRDSQDEATTTTTTTQTTPSRSSSSEPVYASTDSTPASSADTTVTSAAVDDQETTVSDDTVGSQDGTESTTEQDQLKDKLKKEADEVEVMSSKYYIIVAFVVVFVIVLVVIGIVLFLKMKQTRSGHAIISPGPGDNEPLTPSREGAFKFDSPSS